MAFSSDTGMAECLVIANKASNISSDSQRPRFVSLTGRPTDLGSASVISNSIISNDYTRRIEDGPYGGTSVMLGDELTGEMLTTQSDNIGESWGAVRLKDYTLAQVAYSLAQSHLWLPASSNSSAVSIASLSSVSRLGTYHLDIIGPAPRGPFNKMPPSPTATYPALWNHDAKKETRIVCLPDSSLQVRPGLEAKVATVWGTSSRAHINLDFTFGSQALAVAFTDQQSVGGRVWPNVLFEDNRFDCTFAMWGNSTLGLLSWWWHSNRQQSSKAGLTIRSAETLPVLDFRTLTDEQLTKAEKIFEEFREKKLMPAYLADADPNRALLDRRVVCDLLGFDESVYQGVRRLAAKWCAEPSVHGGKARPKNAKFVM